MAFTGPSGNVGSGVRDRYQRILQLAQDAEEGRALPRSGGSSRVDTSLMDRDDERDRTRQQLAMTPGVRRGGSTATRAQSDSPLNVGSGQRFERFGDTYSYDSTAAAEEIGSTEATKEAAAERTRYEALQKMPGFSPRQAARLVFGRGDVIDTDESRQALAAYVRQPSRESAATAIESGASPYSVPFTSGFDPSGERARPGTQAYVDMQLEKFREESSVREERAKREAELRASLRPEARDRMTEVTGPNGEIGRYNLDDNKVDWSGARGPKPGGTRAAGPGAAFMQPSGATGPATPPADPAASFMTPPDDRAARVAKRTADMVPGMDFDSIREAAFTKLVQDGVEEPTPQQLRDMMNRISLARQQMRAGRTPKDD